MNQKRLKDELNELETKFSENGSQSSAKENELKMLKNKIAELEEEISTKIHS